MEPVFYIILILAAMLVLPLVGYFPVYLYRYVKARRAWKKGALTFKPSPVLLGLFLWFLLTFPSLLVGVKNFLTFGARSKQSEAKTNLGAIFTCQTAYFGEHNTYAGRKGENGKGAFWDMGWSPEGDTRYTYYAGGDYIAATKPGHEMKYRPDGDWPFAVRPESANRGFTAMAVGNVDEDECLDVWTMDDSKQLRNLENDIGQSCPAKWTAPELVHKIINDVLKPVLLVAAGVLFFVSPAMLVVVPGLYVRLLRERREYLAALQSTRERINDGQNSGD